jgi:type VI protein secretion system component VasA
MCASSRADLHCLHAAPTPMDPRLLRYYNQELQHLREMGAEFAQQFPKIAARLRMDGIEVGDPYVERLLEGFAFLASRVQLKLDAEFPALHRAAARDRLPELPVADAVDDGGAVAADAGRRGAGQRGQGATGQRIAQWAIRGTHTECRFRTAHDVELWPLENRVDRLLHACRQPAVGPGAGMAQIRRRLAHPVEGHGRPGLQPD